MVLVLGIHGVPQLERFLGRRVFGCPSDGEAKSDFKGWTCVETFQLARLAAPQPRVCPFCTLAEISDYSLQCARISP